MLKLSPWSKRSVALGSILLVMALFVACSDDDSDFMTRPSDRSSSSVCDDCDDGFSSSVTPKSNDSETSVSSSSTKSSSSTAKSSSSVTLATPCKTETEDNCEYGELTDDRDGKKYKTVKIGDQWWMAENLNYETGSNFCFSYGDTNCVKYGRLYAWGDAMDSAGTWSTNGKGCGRFGKDCSPIYPVRGICPNGWHLPDTTEWATLLAAVGGREIAGKKLKSMSGWYDYKGEKGGGTDDFGFSALPAGLLGDDGYYDEGEDAYFWSSMHRGNLSAYDVFLCNQRDAVSTTVSYDNIDAPVSVRCVKDDVPGQTAQFSSSSAKSSSSVTPQSSSSVTPLSSDSETSVSSSSTKSSSSSAKSSSSVKSSSSSAESSSSSVTLATRCKTESKDNCEYGELVDERDGQAYKTVKIGDQWWMAENLNYDTANGYCYNDSAEYCAKYGRLYDWATVMDSAGIWSTNGKGCGYDKTCLPTYPVRGICPSGWHLPSKTEWETLFIAVGGSSVAGWVLKSTSGWNNSGNGLDAFGFSALPAGRRYDKGNYAIEGEGARIWSSTEQNNGGSVYDLCLYDDDNKAFLLNGDKEGGFSVRCVKD